MTALIVRGEAWISGALHVVHDAAQAAHFFAAAGATGATVDERGEGRAVAGRFLRAVAIDDDEAAVERGGAGDDLARNLSDRR